MDPLNFTESALAILQVSGSIISSCYAYRSRLKNAAKDASRIINELNGLRTVIDSLFLLLEVESNEKDTHKSLLRKLAEADGPLRRCEACLNDLAKKLEPEEGWRAARTAMLWRLREPEMTKILQDIASIKSTVQLALAADQRKATTAIQEGITALSLQVSENGLSARRERIFRWLAAPNSMSSHTTARRKCYSATGKWCLDGSEFNEWFLSPRSFLWIHGIPGCGKTILCSTIIDKLSMCSEAVPGTVLSYFYFDFNDSENSKSESLIRSLIVQLIGKMTSTFSIMEKTFAKYQDGAFQPRMTDLLAVLAEILLDFNNVYVVIDALDECTDLDQVLELLTNMQSWSMDHLHILVTSRLLPDIREALLALTTSVIPLDESLIDADILLFITHRLETDRSLAKWPLDVRDLIQSTLSHGAGGMFRWVVCQLDTLKGCLTVNDLKKQLETLPKTLDGTYDQILLRIDDSHRKSALRILQWVSFAVRPVSIEEAAEVLAVDIGDDPHYDSGQKLLDPLDVLLLCSTLVTKEQPSTSNRFEVMPTCTDYDFHHRKGTWVIRLAHLSVKDYLVSDRIKSSKASLFATDQRLANSMIAQTCVAYLLHPAFASGYCDWPTLQNRIKDWPLYYYAVHFWPQHVIYAGDMLDEQTWLLLQRLFRTRESGIGGNYAAWVVALVPHFKLKDILATQPLYFAASFGVTSLIRKLLDTDPNLDIEARGGRAGSSPLHVATFRNRTAAVKLLLEANANPMSQNRFGETKGVGTCIRSSTAGAAICDDSASRASDEDAVQKTNTYPAPECSLAGFLN
ncbi:hypothetical protein N431DRAFT_484077 [Stipitochalara longipes BDJ]|nr:hypothetical protein N431DRAFT_484077 [Stipitochalara longipes BDJ]